MSRDKKNKTSVNEQVNKNQPQMLEEQENDEDNAMLLTMETATQILEDSKLRGHSTPVRGKNPSNNIENSPESNYNCSPILFPCTQEVNEVTWDWQASTKNSCDKKKSENELISTPKQSKLLQRKRNSNSPLLYKPLKRKLIKGDNTDSIGMFAAELQALTEKMKSCIQHSGNEDEKKKEEDKSTNTNVGKDDTNQNATNSASTNKQNPSFDELFDESIEDSMAKCSQEIEEKYMCSLNKETSSSCNSASEGSKNSLLSLNSPILNVNTCAKTYVKPPSTAKKTSHNVQVSEEKIKPLVKAMTFDNVKSVNKKTTLRRHNSELFQIPDDSFDECLASCVEDEKILSVFAEYDNVCPESDSKRNEKSYKHVALNSNNYNNNNNNKPPSKSRTNNNTLLSKSNEKCDSKNNVVAENKKFFKTKSLSDSYFPGEKSSSGRVSTAINSSNIVKISSNSTTLQSRQNQVQNTGTRVTINGNKTNSQTVQHCSAEEIERKRLEAKMRLEAKRKLQFANGKIPIQR